MSDFSLPKVAARDMVLDKALGDSKNNNPVKIADYKSFRHQVADEIHNFSEQVTPQLKKMKISYLEKV